VTKSEDKSAIPLPAPNGADHHVEPPRPIAAPETDAEADLLRLREALRRDLAHQLASEARRRARRRRLVLLVGLPLLFALFLALWVARSRADQRMDAYERKSNRTGDGIITDTPRTGSSQPCTPSR
jgi:hypothetical protein